MDYFAGLDVSVKHTSVCIVDEAGKITREVKVRLAIGFWRSVPVTTFCCRSTRRLFGRKRLTIVARLGKWRVAALILAAV